MLIPLFRCLFPHFPSHLILNYSVELSYPNKTYVCGCNIQEGSKLFQGTTCIACID